MLSSDKRVDVGCQPGASGRCRVAKPVVSRSWLTPVAAVLLAVGLSACKDDLYTNLQEAQANEVVATLRAHGISADKKTGLEGMWVVAVDSDRFAEAVSVLKARGIPSNAPTGLGETFKRQGLVSTPVEERARLVHALSEELSRTLMQIDGVVIARVHVVLPERDSAIDNPKAASATVFIKHRPDIDLTQQVAKIKAIVANGVEGATYENVSVALFPAVEPQPLVSVLPHKSSMQFQAAHWLLGAGGLLIVLGVAVAAFLKWGGALGKGRQSLGAGRPGVRP